MYITALRVEWCRSRARALRWHEEVELLEEEMRRVLLFLQWHGDWWHEQVDRQSLPDAVAAEGYKAYAMRQASFRYNLWTSFQRLWSFVSADILFPDN